MSKLLLLASVLAAAWAIVRFRRVALNPQPEPPGVARPGPSDDFTLSIGGGESAGLA